MGLTLEEAIGMMVKPPYVVYKAADLCFRWAAESRQFELLADPSRGVWSRLDGFSGAPDDGYEAIWELPTPDLPVCPGYQVCRVKRNSYPNDARLRYVDHDGTLVACDLDFTRLGWANGYFTGGRWQWTPYPTCYGNGHGHLQGWPGEVQYTDPIAPQAVRYWIGDKP